MAGLAFTLSTGSVAYTTATKTIMQIVAASNHRVLINEVSIGFLGVLATEVPVHVQILAQTTAGTMSSLTPVKTNSSDDETLQTTAQHTATAEPTAGNVIWADVFHPQTARRITFNPGRELVIPGGTRLGLRLLSPAQSGTVSVTAMCVE